MDDAFDEKDHPNNRRTIQAYEGYARQYAAAVPQEASGFAREGIERMAKIVPKGKVLEFGSGPGWDADFAESLGLTVRRTDVTQAFREFQMERGKKIEALDILVDDFGGPYDAVIALYVLQHIDPEQIETILGKICKALNKDGIFLVSLREGDGVIWERSEKSGAYFVALWDEANFLNHLKSVGLEVVWKERNSDGDGDWLFFLAQKQQDEANHPSKESKIIQTDDS